MSDKQLVDVDKIPDDITVPHSLKLKFYLGCNVGKDLHLYPKWIIQELIDNGTVTIESPPTQPTTTPKKPSSRGVSNLSVNRQLAVKLIEQAVEPVLRPRTRVSGQQYYALEDALTAVLNVELPVNRLEEKEAKISDAPKLELTENMYSGDCEPMRMVKDARMNQIEYSLGKCKDDHLSGWFAIYHPDTNIFQICLKYLRDSLEEHGEVINWPDRYIDSNHPSVEASFVEFLRNRGYKVEKEQ